MNPEPTRPSRLPLVLLALAALGIAALGTRLVVSERGNVERERRAQLEVDAARSAQRVSDLVASAIADALARRVEPVVTVRDGRFERPADAVAATSLAVVHGRDPEGEFLLEDAERNERDGDLDRALGALTVAMNGARDPTIRAIAGARRAAILRGRGEQDVARDVSRLALDAMDESAKSTSREALLLRFLDEPADESTIEALARLVAGPDDALARAMLSATEAGRAAIVRREAALAARARFEAARLRPERGGAVATRVGSRLMVATTEGDGAVLGFEFDLPSVESGHRLVSADEPAPHDRLVARAPVGALLAGSSVEASCPLADLDAAFTVRGAWIGALLLAVVAAIGGALWAWSRAAARERALARARSDFVARVGHDLRTPLSLIRMYAETIATGRVEDRAQTLEFAGIVTRESERLSKLVGTVLDFARVGANASMRREIELSEWTREVVASLQPLLDRAGFAVEIDVSPVTAPVDADALRGALCNLIENALAHADSGKSLVVRCRREGDRAVLEVEDRGPGVPEDELGRVFDRFVRGRDASGKGVGLGLALVREVVLAHGGTVEARLRDGSGLAFTISLPTSAANVNGRQTT